MSDRKPAADIQPVTRMTIPMLTVLDALVNGDGWYGLRIAEATAMRTGTVYPILARFERAGWVTSSWEDKEDPGEKNDPGAKRKYYRLTSEGRESALAALRLREKALVKSHQASGALPRAAFGHLPERTVLSNELLRQQFAAPRARHLRGAEAHVPGHEEPAE